MFNLFSLESLVITNNRESMSFTKEEKNEILTVNGNGNVASDPWTLIPASVFNEMSHLFVKKAAFLSTLIPFYFIILFQLPG